MKKSMERRLGKARARNAAPKSGETEQAAKDTAEGSSFVAEFAKWSALLVTVSTLFLTLLGYGHDVVYLEQFGLRAEELQHAPLDFLLRAWHPMAFAIDRFTKASFFSWEADLLKAFVDRHWPSLLAAALIWPVLVYALRGNLAKRAWHTISATDTHRKVCTSFAKLRIHLVACLLVPALLVLLLFGGAVAHAVFGVGMVWFAGIPALGAKSGEIRANEEVLKASGCLSSSMKEGARCVRLIRDDKELARGYLIDYGGGRIYLYRPCDKRVVALSLERSTVETMSGGDDLDPNKACVKTVAAPAQPTQPLPIACPVWFGQNWGGPPGATGHPRARRGCHSPPATKLVVD